MSQTRTVPSSLHDASAFESARQARPVTALRVPAEREELLAGLRLPDEQPAEAVAGRDQQPLRAEARPTAPSRSACGRCGAACRRGPTNTFTTRPGPPSTTCVLSGEMSAASTASVSSPTANAPLPRLDLEPDDLAGLPADPAGGEQHLAVAGEPQGVDLALGERQRRRAACRRQVEDEHLSAARDREQAERRADGQGRDRRRPRKRGGRDQAAGRGGRRGRGRGRPAGLLDQPAGDPACGSCRARAAESSACSAASSGLRGAPPACTPGCRPACRRRPPCRTRRRS